MPILLVSCQELNDDDDDGNWEEWHETTSLTGLLTEHERDKLIAEIRRKSGVTRSVERKQHRVSSPTKTLCTYIHESMKIPVWKCQFFELTTLASQLRGKDWTFKSMQAVAGRSQTFTGDCGGFVQLINWEDASLNDLLCVERVTLNPAQ